MDSLSLASSSSKITHGLREKEEKRAQERRKNLLYLVAAFLRDQGFVNSTETYVNEAQLSSDIQVCDNIDLDTILYEYVEFYYSKYNKYPKICKKTGISGLNCPQQRPTISKETKKEKFQNLKKHEEEKKNEYMIKQEDFENWGLTVTPLSQNSYFHAQGKVEKFTENIFNDEKSLKPLSSLFLPGSEFFEIATLISREIVLNKLNVYWDDVKGLDNCKTVLKEAIVYPLKYPNLFKGKISPWKGILLYGPPGTGKTMLAKAVATECRATFFNITSSSLISKWRGDSEKYVRVLLELARHYEPSIIFIDEIDWTANGAEDLVNKNSEPARRFRAEFLGRLDGLLTMESANIVLLAATNVPWNLDAALSRRLEKKIFVDVPDEKTRQELLEIYVNKKLHGSEDLKKLIEDTKDYSCADLKLLCKEAWILQLRPILKQLEDGREALKDIETYSLIDDIKYLEVAFKYLRSATKSIRLKYLDWGNEKI